MAIVYVCVLMFFGFTVIGAVNPVPDNCEQYHQPSFGERKLQNTDFVFRDSGVITGGRTYVTVGISGPSDAYIILSPNKNVSDDLGDDVGIPKILIGELNNQYSRVICNSNDDIITNRYPTPDILTEYSERFFSISWTDNVLTVKRFGSSTIIFTHQLECPVTVGYIGTSTGYTEAGVWFSMCTADLRTYRDDGNCGPNYYAPNGQRAICPGECCNSRSYCTSFPGDCDYGSWLDYEPAVPTGPPTNLNARYEEDNSLFITWDPPEVQERHAAIKWYYFYYRSSNTSDETEVILQHYIPREHRIFNPDPGAQYSYRVVAYTGVGSGPSSSVKYFTVPTPMSEDTRHYREDGRCGPDYMAPNGQQAVCPGECCSTSGHCGLDELCYYPDLYRDYRNYRPAAPSGPPTDVVVEFLYDERAMLISWNPPHVNDRNARIASYYVTYYRGANINPWSDVGVAQTVRGKTNARFEHLYVNTYYGVRVRAHSVVGAGPSSNFTYVWAGQGAPPTTPEPVITPEPDRRNFRDDLRCGPDYPAPNGQEAICPGECCDARRICSYQYYNCYVAIRYANYESYRPKVASGPPTNLSTQYEADNTILFTWDPPEINKRHAVIRGYNVVYRNTDTGSGSTIYVESPVPASPVLEQRIFNPDRGAQYAFKVRAKARPNDYGPYSSELLVSIPEADNIEDPRPYRDDGKCGPGSIAPNGQQAVCPGQCCSVKGLCDYYSCRDFGIYRDYRDYQPAQPTGPPTNVNAEYEAGINNIAVTWNPPELDKRNALITGYRVSYYLSNNIDNIISTQVTDTELLLCTPEPGLRYTFQVLAYTSSGDGPLSSEVFASTPAPATPEPAAATPETDTRNYRDDYRCGPGFVAPNGAEAICPGACCDYNNYCGTNYWACTTDVVTDYRDYTPNVPSGPPTNVNAQYEADNTILFTWSPPEINERNAAIGGYKAYYRNTNTPGETEVNVQSRYDDYRDGVRVYNPDPGAQYSFRVLAYTQAGNGPSNSAVLFTAPAGSSVEDPRPFRDDGKCGPGRLAPNGQQAVCPGECCTACGICNDFCGSPSGSEYRDYHDYQPSLPTGPPTNVNAEYNVNTNTIEVTWNPPEVDKLPARIIRYRVTYSITNSGDVVATEVTDTKLTVSDVDSDNYAQYAFRILAISPGGDGPSSSEVFASMAEAVVTTTRLPEPEPTTRKMDLFYVTPHRLSGPSGEDYTFTCLLQLGNPGPFPQIIWQRNNNALYNNEKYTVANLENDENEARSILTIKNAEEEDNGQYTCIVGDNYNSYTSTLDVFQAGRGQVPTTPESNIPTLEGDVEIILSEGQGVETIINLPVLGALKHIVIPRGERVVLTCKVTTEGAQDVVWTHENNPISYGGLFLGSSNNIQVTEDLSKREWTVTIGELSESEEGQWACAHQSEGGDLAAAIVKLTITDAEPTPDQPSATESPESTCNIKPRRYDITDMGMGCYFRGWTDVQGQGASNDYCRVVGLSSGGQLYFSCALAGTAGESEYNFNSPNASEVWFDVGHTDTWYVKDEDGDGKDDYCRCVGNPPDTFVSCMKSGETGFIGLDDFRPANAIPNCSHTKVNPFLGPP